MKLIFLFIFPIIALSGCAITHQMIVPSTIPAEMQQLIKSTKVEEVEYSFIPNDNANDMQFETVIGWATRVDEINLNSSFRYLVDELIQTKFSKINNNNKNKVVISVQKINYTREEPQNLSMTVNVFVNHQDKQDEKNISYSVNLNHSEKDKSIYDFLMKFVIGIDKFLDNKYEVQ